MIRGVIIPKIMRKIILYLVVAMICLAVIFPIYWMINTSLQTERSLFKYPPLFYPRSVNLEGYRRNIQKGDIFIWIKNTAIVALGAVVLNLILSSLAGYCLARYNFKGKHCAMLLILSTQMIPASLIIIPLYIIFARLHLINTLFCLILANVGLQVSLSTWILRGFFESIPREIEEAALIDGCSRFSVFLKVSLPVCTPGLIAVALITFFDTWEEYLFAVTLISSQTKWVGSQGLASFVGVIVTPWDMVMSAATILSVLPIVFYILLQKYIVQGFTSGAVKI